MLRPVQWHFAARCPGANCRLPSDHLQIGPSRAFPHKLWSVRFTWSTVIENAPARSVAFCGTVPWGQLPPALRSSSDRTFESIPAQTLERKVYLVNGDRECSGPFSGILRHGALGPIAACPPIIFMFREQERQAARDLVRALRGQVSHLNFVGFQKLFRVELDRKR